MPMLGVPIVMIRFMKAPEAQC